MQFSQSLIPGKLVKRYKRFLADIMLEDGQQVTAHCPNTGAMTACAEPGWHVFLSPSNNPKRKLAYTWELSINDQGHWIGVNTQNANKLVAEAIQKQALAAFQGYSELKQEVKYGSENSRVDLLLSEKDKANCYIEVKSVTLLRENGQGVFPDAVTQRGQKHLRELMHIAQQGNRAVLVFCVQHTGIKRVTVAKDIDAKYAQLLAEAMANGVEVHAFGCTFNDKKVEINQDIPFNL